MNAPEFHDEKALTDRASATLPGHGLTDGLAVALLLDGLMQPHWVYEAIERVAGSGIAQIALVCVTGRAVGTGRHAAPARLWSVYQRLDDLLFSAGPDPNALVDVTPLLAAARFCSLDALSAPEPGGSVDRIGEQAQAGQFDVLLLFGEVPVTERLLALPRYGVWSYRFGASGPGDGKTAGCPEVMLRSATTEAVLVMRRAGHETELRRGRARTIPFSVRRNRDNILRKASGFAAQELKRLHAAEERTPGTDAFDGLSQTAVGHGANGQCPPPSARQLAQVGGRIVSHALHKAACVNQWLVAYAYGPSRGIDERLQHCTPLIPPKDRSWADPFPFLRDGHYFLFVEELPYAVGKGHISVMEQGANGSWGSPVKVLERDYHLSYPFLFEWRGELFMIPETGQNRTVELYRCTSFPGEWVPEEVLLEDIYSADATLALIDGKWWMFVIGATEHTEPYDELYLFYADTPLGPWHPHRRNPVKCDARSARPAGGLFNWNGGLYRPAQICTPIYGHGISINKINDLSETDFAEQEVRRIDAGWRPGLLGCHTLNRAGALLVTDGFMRHRRIP